MPYGPLAPDLAKAFAVKNLLRQRGLDLVAEGDINSTLASNYPTIEQFYEFFEKSENRKEIKTTIKADASDHELRFTKSFEWYVARLLERDFAFFSSAFSVRITDSPSGTDFDVLGFGLNQFIHIECKTGNPRNLNKNTAENFKKKCQFLNADINILYIDTNGLDHKSHDFLKYIHETFSTGTTTPLYKIEKSAMGIYQVGFQPIFLIDTNKSTKSARKNLQEVFYICFRASSSLKTQMGTSPNELKKFGYTVEEITFQ